MIFVDIEKRLKKLKNKNMPKVDPKSFGKFLRIDGKPGWREILPTKQRYVEADKTDVRLRRVKVFGAGGKLEHTYLMDEMGAHFKDMPIIKNDLSYLESLKPSSPEQK